MLDLTTIRKGTRLRVAGGVVAEVLDNMNDGEWLRVRLIEAPAGHGAPGDEELCHATDIVEIL